MHELQTQGRSACRPWALGPRGGNCTAERGTGGQRPAAGHPIAAHSAVRLQALFRQKTHVGLNRGSRSQRGNLLAAGRPVRRASSSGRETSLKRPGALHTTARPLRRRGWAPTVALPACAVHASPARSLRSQMATSEELREQGNSAFRSGDYLQAAAAYTRALRVTPSSAVLYRSACGVAGAARQP